MSINSRLHKIEAGIDKLYLNDNELNYSIIYKKLSDEEKIYKIKENGIWKWATEEECSKFLERYKDSKGLIIFMPEKLKS